ncbi:MAG: nucleotidyltransferase domain-containing protein [Syntrophaceae bacterium]|nr:nucleotidyltransferase domain-containing protein [Syntrophaceae bacterium]
MNILIEIISSRARAEFFRILFGTDSHEYHLREIQRRAKMAIGTIRQEAKKLENIGLVNKRIDGNRTYYQANKNHPLFNTIHDLVLKTTGLAEILKKPLSMEVIKFAFVFGSIAAGKENPESDIDLFIIGDIGLRAVSKLLKEPSQKISREINPHIMTSEEFIKRKIGKEHFVTTVLSSPKLMILGNENDLTKLGE